MNVDEIENRLWKFVRRVAKRHFRPQLHLLKRRMRPGKAEKRAARVIE